MHLRYDYLDASYAGVNEHAETGMKKLGITWQHSTPQSISDCFWFWNCENIPKELPKYINELKQNPLECIGWGLSKEMAQIIHEKEIELKNEKQRPNKSTVD